MEYRRLGSSGLQLSALSVSLYGHLCEVGSTKRGVIRLALRRSGRRHHSSTSIARCRVHSRCLSQ